MNTIDVIINDRVITIKELSIKEHQQLLPIPQRELYANPNMTQNPGYDS